MMTLHGQQGAVACRVLHAMQNFGGDWQGMVAYNAKPKQSPLVAPSAAGRWLWYVLLLAMYKHVLAQSKPSPTKLM